MNENTKTLSFVGAAAVLLLAAWMLRPSPVSMETQDDIGKEFFPEFKDPSAATSLEIVEYDGGTGTLKPFKVAQVNGVWSIPSHESYPADGKNQLEQAALAVMGLTKLSMVSDSPSDHETYGVVDPDANKLEFGAEGVGKRLTLEDKSGNKLAQLIIGKKDPDRPDLHYVRMPGQDRVYRAVVKTDKLSTKFQNWIEEDLLKLNAFDVKEVVMDDHSVDELNPNQPLIQRGVTIVDYDSKDSKWKLEKMEALDPKTGKWEEVKLAEDEELDSQKLNDLKTALDDLKIVDVAHKPPGLSNELKVGDELVADRATRLALQRRGFYLAKVQDGYALFSNEGEVRCGLNDGVEYVLRFGEIAGQGSADEDEDSADSAADKAAGDKADGEEAAAKKDADEKETDKKDAEKGKDKGVDRYIMVTAHFREDLIPKPELQPLPEGSEESSEQPAAETGAQDAADMPAEPAKNTSSAFQPGDETLLAMADDAPATSLAQATKNAQRSGQAKSAGKQPSAAKAPEKTAPKTEQPAKADQTKADAAEKPGDGNADAEKPATDAAQPADPDAALEAAEKAKTAAAAERKRIEDENKRKEDEYKKKIEDGEKRVKDLNERFSDWYYVISDKTYQKIHINRDQLVKKKTKPAGEGNAPADFDALKNLPK